MRGLPSTLLYMITVGFRTKIFTTFFTANQFACDNVKIIDPYLMLLPSNLDLQLPFDQIHLENTLCCIWNI